MVYVVQEVMRCNVIDALRFGELYVLLPPGDVVLSAGPTTRKLQRALAAFTDADYLLLIGDPVAIGLACAVASEINQGRFQVLKWDRQNYIYYPVAVDLFRKAVKSD